jgi:hypothetical protein
MYSSLEQAAHYHIFGLKFGGFMSVPHLEVMKFYVNSEIIRMSGECSTHIRDQNCTESGQSKEGLFS